LLHGEEELFYTRQDSGYRGVKSAKNVLKTVLSKPTGDFAAGFLGN